MKYRTRRHRQKRPTLQSIRGVLVGKCAAAALEMLERQREAGLLYYYRRLGTQDEFNVWLEDRLDQVVPVPKGGRRLTLQEWCLAVYPVLLAHRVQDRDEHQGRYR